MNPTALPGTDQRAAAILETFVADLRRRLADLVAEVYPTGSALTDDWQTAHSDLDVVFVVRRPVTPSDADVLTQLHAATRGAHCVDGVYLTAAQLAGGPDAVDAAPQAVDGRFSLEKRGGQLSWVTWRERSTAARGVVDDQGVIGWREPIGGFTQFRELADFCRHNLATYWAGVGDQWQSALDAGALGDEQVDTDSVVWTVLGPARLITTIETGTVVSKTASGQLAATRWPQYGELVTRCIRSRQGEVVSVAVQDVRDTVDLVRLIVAAGQSAEPIRV